MARSEQGQSRLPVLLMAGGGVVLVAALVYFVFGRDSGTKKDSAAKLAARCAFPACRAAGDPGLGRGYEGESVAVDPKDENHIVVTDAKMTSGHCTWHVTFDRGKDWTDGVFQEPEGFTGCHINGRAGGHVPTGPGGVSFGPSGTIYATYGSAPRSEQDTREGVILGKSNDGGKTFTTSLVAAPPEGFSYARPQMSVALANDRDRVMISFWMCHRTPDGDVCDQSLFARSDDGGGSFAPPVTVNDPPAGQTPSEPLQAPDGAIYVTFVRRFSNGTADLLLARSTDAGATFTSSKIDTQPSIGDRYDPAKLAWDARANSLYVVYSDSRAGNQQVFFRKSSDKGITWTDPIGIAPDQNATSTGESRTPNISVALGGRIDVVYYRRPQADTDNVFWAYSLDGGSRFLSRQVNEKPIRRFEFNRAIGDWYPPDVASTDDAAYVVWSDSANAEDQDANTQDIFLRRMTVAGGGDLPP